ncbi:cbb3-type cytochrome oxidase assembly protein CcoS [Pedobacter petrophilus]|jgi:cbb3-type cytochrome oxidase maturation protein|uniref:Cbb3-type cytochrome oxidase assembly protein CcoS n=1 Tax=Pedobacter petrophilus TaxID=1908241 RepID=A0A7K0G4I0_9SPHI|nr:MULTISPECIES: cbb3-type cytochrome oxidase assembly protein CcoS [Pedobacter]MDY0907628.1 cbb3-type cytochrome oxidase assembly protein CcoS [Pedobacter sp. CFBP9032]MRX78611.1 cbb3-type cytochrome oxidase assembly protein CcoS [Pedobacter petrophilus]
MNILYFLVGCSVLMALIFLGAFIWAAKTGQNDDVYTPGVRILFDDEVTEEKSEEDHFSS